MTGLSKLRMAVGPDGLLLQHAGRVWQVGVCVLADVCERAKVPFEYIGELPPTLAAQNLNHGLAALPDEGRAVRVHGTDGLAMTVSWPQGRTKREQREE